MPMKSKLILGWGLLALAAASLPAQEWRPVGPAGGDVISLEADPHDVRKLYLGASDGHVFFSQDEGAHWQLLSRIGTGQDDVVTHILVDPRHSNRLYASTWTLGSGGGGVYRSDDGGRSWRLVGLEKETVRALAFAPTNPDILVAGSLSGVYRSNDAGKTWTRITPANHEDLKNFDSVAIDPRDANIIYAGTYHLPWKTENGGKDWFPIGKGMIDDSDVMNIIIDPQNPENMHATACSGIYHSTNAAGTWNKYKGIPFVFRRTQLIRQDPKHPQTLYAGTTSGLWKTTDEGVAWKRVTPGDWVVNALVVDLNEPNRVILGTERYGVQVSNDAGATFRASNEGFVHEHILDVAIDRDRPERSLVVLTYDVQPFIATRDGGSSWTLLGPGLKRTEMQHVYAAPNGWWATLRAGGWMRYDEVANKWVRAGLFSTDAPAAQSSTRTKKASGGAAAKRPAAARAAQQFVTWPVNEMVFGRETWYAATNGGIIVSRDRGTTWRFAAPSQLVKQSAQSLTISSDGSQVWAVAGRNLVYSADNGRSWDSQSLTFSGAGNLRLRYVENSGLFIASNLGLYASSDAGRNWKRQEISELQFQDVAGVGNAIVVALHGRGLLYSRDAGRSWQRVQGPLAEGFFPVLTTRRSGALVAVSATEGMLTADFGGGRSADAGGPAGAGGGSSPQIQEKPQR
jgi:photosystem II stability/assembly factor-like uncharacterized protein